MIDDGQKDINDTKPLPEHAPKDAPPDKSEGDEMPIEIPPGDEALRAHVIKLTMRVGIIEARLLTPKQIEEMYQRIADDTVDRVETLLNDVTSRFSDLVSSASQIESINQKLAARATNAAESDRKLDAVIRFINTLAADDVTDPDSKKAGKSWFERMEESIKTSDERSLSAAMEVSQVRIDAAESTHQLKEGIAAVTAIAEDLKPVALSVARAQSLIDIGLRLAKRPRLAFGLFVAGFAAFGGSAVVTPELIKAIGNVIVSAFAQGVN